MKVPHMGWNEADAVDPSDPFWEGLSARTHFYFVHSYFPSPGDDSIVGSWTEYGTRFASSIRVGNIVATQFHPENFVRKIAEPALAVNG